MQPHLKIQGIAELPRYLLNRPEGIQDAFKLQLQRAEILSLRKEAGKSIIFVELRWDSGYSSQVYPLLSEWMNAGRERGAMKMDVTHVLKDHHYRIEWLHPNYFDGGLTSAFHQAEAGSAVLVGIPHVNSTYLFDHLSKQSAIVNRPEVQV